MRGPSVVLAALVAVLVSRAVPAAAIARPDLVAGIGRTAVVEGEPGGGGASLSLALLWPVEDHFRVGLMGFADDLGEERGQLVGPGGEDLGPIAGAHRSALGGAWRMEAHLPTAGAWDAFLAATWGGYRVMDDLHGDRTRTLNAVGFGMGLGVARRLAATHAAGITLRYQQLSRGEAQRYLSAAVEWRWGGDATE